MKQNLFLEMNDIKDLSTSERQVVNYVLSHHNECLSMGIVELGAKSYSSASTVMRVVKKLGLLSFTDFKNRLNSDHKQFLESKQLYSDIKLIDESDSSEVIIEKVTNNSVRAVLEVRNLNNVETFERVVNLIQESVQIDFYGSGVSNLICHDAKFKALRGGLKVTAYSFTAEMLMQAKLSTKDNVAILVSYTGQTDEIIKIARILKQNNVPSISITSYTNNPVASLTSIQLYVDNCESVYRVGGMGSRTSIQNVLDIVFALLFAKSSYARHNIARTVSEDIKVPE